MAKYSGNVSHPLEKDSSLTNADKLFYIRSSICCEEGKALVNSATGSGDDYDDIVIALKKRFNRKRYTYKSRLNLILQHKVHSFMHNELRKSVDFWKAQLLGLKKSGHYNISSFHTSIEELSFDEDTFKEWSVHGIYRNYCGPFFRLNNNDLSTYPYHCAVF